MENMPDKKNDALRKLINNNMLESVPANFTDDVMSRLGIETSKSTFVYEPVISKKGWIFILFLFISIISFLFLSYDAGNSAAGFKSQVVVQQAANSFMKAITGSAVFYFSLLSGTIFILFFLESLFRESRLRTFHI